MADDIEYQNQRELEIARSRSLNNNTLASQAKEALKSVAVDKAKKQIGKVALQALSYVAPFIGIFLLILLGIAVIIYVSCATIPGSGLFINICKDVNMSKEDRDSIKNSKNINNAVNSICNETGGSYNSYGNDCGYGY